MNELPATRRVIRSKETGLWIDNEGKWTSDFDRARGFEGIVAAINAVESGSLENVQFVIRFGYSMQPDYVMDLFGSRPKSDD